MTPTSSEVKRRATNRRLRARTVRIARKLEKFLGVPTPAVKKAPPLEMLIATLLSQNTNDRNSHRAYVQLRQRYPTWEGILRAPGKELADTIRVGGMANQKSARIKNILATVKEKCGKFDLRFLKKMTDEEVYEELLSFNGVGLKTAACVLVFSLGRDVFPVDTHIHRICGRLGLAPNCKTPEKTFEYMKGVVPKGRAYSFHTNLIRFGRTVCKSQNPRCGICPLYSECKWAEKSKFAARLRSTQRVADADFMLLDNV
ncbi:MAG: endonuclease III [Bacteroidota bacterium]